MLKNISWTEFIGSMAVLLFIYYSVVAVIFYKQIFKDFLRKREFRKYGIINAKGQSIFEPFTKHLHAAIDQPTPLIMSAHTLSGEIMRVINKKLVKEELLFEIAARIRDYPYLKGTSLEEIITKIVEDECVEKRSLHLSREELSGLWKG